MQSESRMNASAPSLATALIEEERSGLKFALAVRCFALAAIVVWLLVSVPFPRVTYWLGLAAIFFVSGAVPYLMRRRKDWRVWVMVFAAVDALVLVMALLLPNPLATSGWPIQMGLRFQNDLYLFVLLAGAALSYSPLLVVWTGVVASVAWGIGTFLIARLPETITVYPPDTGDPALDSETALRTFLEPTFFNITGRMNELVLLAVTAAIIAAAVWRSRRLVLRLARAERARANLARYMSPDLANRLAREDISLTANEQRHVAVLFVDMIGFTEIAEQSTPANTMVMLRGFHRRVVQAVFRHGGTVDNYAGDSVMATFGALGEDSGAARRALQTACEILDTVDRWNAKRAARGAAPLSVGIGVHYGPVVVGNVGDDQHLQFTAIGDTVNVASRMERLTRDHHTPILASGDVIDAARPDTGEESPLLTRFCEAGVVPVRGRRGEVALWRLRGEEPPSSAL